MMANKKEIVRALEQIALYLEILGENSFKVSAYRKAANALEGDERTMDQIDDVSKIKGIGKGTATVIIEMMDKGESELLNELQEKVPSELITLLQVPNLGGKKIAKLYSELGVTNIETLKEACKAGKVRGLAGFGAKTEEKILASLDDIGKRPERLPIAYMLPIAESIEAQLENMKHIEKFSRAGSIRRFKETIKDLDFIISSKQPAKVKEQLLNLQGVTDVIASGDTKVSLVLGEKMAVSVDFRIVEPEQFATTLHHFTGSMEHNVKMRQLAKARGEKISEYGVEHTETGENQTFETEEEFYAYFGLNWIPPEARETGEEIELLKEEYEFIQISDIKGDLHLHSTWSDGAFSIEEMAEEARSLGYTYMAITDHSQYLRVANGLTPERIRMQRKEIDKLNKKYEDFKIFAGIEMDILPDGTLDYDDELLEEMDFVIASIHSAFSQDRDKIMKRLKTALDHKKVDLIAHPTGRLIGRRTGYDVDVELLLQLAKETDTAIELNANPNRLDLSPDWLRKAQDLGVKIAINTDAHYKETMKHMEIGAAVARKGFINKSSVINTMTLKEFEAYLNRKK
ncbi:DNA polymerase/3'-5' exonuclease PolX [Fictibacillus phosphorivorans]|uniref:DNA polymerase/3'-5' exonuclease PolX n=1 Tax=Fictibacillus phosphorivorans TaxID=1221500 RepID=UPI00204267A0|nr:DNA polymerase/3'-5' exonuclease PolX [Fictibacillus phosphorivorans]MCM3717873.1 DNA polymerase/3'-5' exonuclease PolX [Fictibacillus phosphorivorans]MCM3775322.1 DNA polymerase/3'-5' exonuclease PolX [Fictibacillus phosphorivorans]